MTPNRQPEPLELLTAPERRLASELVDHWDEIHPLLRLNGVLREMCQGLLERYGRDMIERLQISMDRDNARSAVKDRAPKESRSNISSVSSMPARSSATKSTAASPAQPNAVQRRFHAALLEWLLMNGNGKAA